MIENICKELDKQEYVVVCSMEDCHKVKVSESIWIRPTDAYYKKWYDERRLSHGFCPEGLEQYKKENGL